MNLFSANLKPRLATHRHGFTLLELFLTLSLSIVLMTLINSAFRFYAGDMDSSDTDMRRTMLASALMQMVEDDLRATLHPEPLDTSALEELLSATASAAGGGGAGGGGGGGGGGDDASADEAAGMEDPGLVDEEPITSEVGLSVLMTPGLIGNQYQIQIDTSRLPRLEEYSVLLDVDPGNLSDLPSDLKTVTYYLQTADSIGVKDPLTEFDSGAGAGSGGLVRRVLDRSATTFASASGNLAALGQTGELLAPEITGLEFSYWDGLTWQIEWNSDELGELPLAVKIQMAMTEFAPDGTEQEPRLFQHIVRLPMGKYIEEEEGEFDEVTGI